MGLGFRSRLGDDSRRSSMGVAPLVGVSQAEVSCDVGLVVHVSLEGDGNYGGEGLLREDSVAARLVEVRLGAVDRFVEMASGQMMARYGFDRGRSDLELERDLLWFSFVARWTEREESL